MAKAKKKSTAAKDGVADMTATMLAGNPALAKSWATLMSESARFLSERLQEDLEAQKALLACKTPAEVVEVQSEFFQKAMVDYTQEAQRMFRIMSGATEEALKDAKTGTKRDYDDIPV